MGQVIFLSIKVAMMQPTFLPWLGYFELISKADKFIFLDDFQFVYQSFDHRNRLFVNKDFIGWLTISVDKKNGFLKPINETGIREDLKWRNKLWQTIKINYSKAPYFSAYSDILEPLIAKPQYNLAKQNISLILAISKILEDSCNFLYSSQISVNGKRSVRVKNLLEKVNADVYLAAHGSFGYMLEDGIFPLSKIEVKFQNANLKSYDQHASTKGFVPYLSILDALFNVGADETKKLIDVTTDHWLSWEEMKAVSKPVSSIIGGGIALVNH